MQMIDLIFIQSVPYFLNCGVASCSNEDNSLPKLLTRLSSLIKPRPSGNPGAPGGGGGVGMQMQGPQPSPQPSHSSLMGLSPSTALGPPPPESGTIHLQ